MKSTRQALRFSQRLTSVTMPLVAAALVVGGFSAPTVEAVPWTPGDVFASTGVGQYNVYSNGGVFKQTISDPLGGGAAGCSFNAAADKLYTTNFFGGAVVVYDGADPHAALQTITTGDTHPESIVFDAAGNFYVGHADGNHTIKKFSAAGALLATFSPATEDRGTDWIELAKDQCTIFYTSEGGKIKRFNVCNNAQLADFANLGDPTITGDSSYALRLLPPFDGSGGLLVANTTTIKRLNGSGAVIQTYTAPNQGNWFALNLDPNGTSFWSGDLDTGQFFRFNISSGAVEVGPISNGMITTGLCVKAEQPIAATITGVTGTVQAKVQGVLMPVGPGSLITKGTELVTGSDGLVSGACVQSSSFSLGTNTSLFLDDSLCAPTTSGFVDVSRGQFTLVGPSGQSTVKAANVVETGARTPVTQAIPAGAADFITTYTQSGQTGTAVTTVQRGTVSVTNTATGTVSVITAGQSITSIGQVPGLVAAVLPTSRSVLVGTAATAFATIINAGRAAAIVCQMVPLTSVPATFSFQTTDSGNNVIGLFATPVSIAGGAAQSFVFALTPTAAFPPTEIQLSFTCAGTTAPVVVGLDTLLLSACAAATPCPDLVAIAATIGNTGTVNIPGTTGTGVFAVATTNVGAAGTITASADTGSVSLPVGISICQTNPTTGICLAPPTSSVMLPIATNAQPTFGIFVTGDGTPVPFDPANKRIFVRFKDAGSATRGATSVAVQTQ